MNAIAPLALPGRTVSARLEFRCAAGRTWLGAQHTPHPFHITRPFHLDGDPPGMATLYLQSSAGGLYGDDDLRLDVSAAPGAAVYLTTQASTVVHDARGGLTRQAVRLSLSADALLEYLPDPMILFAGARVAASLTLTLAPGARAVIADAALCHDPGLQGRPFDHFSTEIRLQDPGGAPLLIDRIAVSGADWARRTGAFPCHGSILVAGAPHDLDRALRAALGDAAIYAGVSTFADRALVLVRILARDGAALTRALHTAWACARAAMTGCRPAARRK